MYDPVARPGRVAGAPDHPQAPMLWRAPQGRAGAKMGEYGGHFEAPALK
jgi:hypothetical protein